MYMVYVLAGGIISGLLLRPIINLFLRIKTRNHEITESNKKHIEISKPGMTFLLCLVNVLGWIIMYEIYGFGFDFLFTSFVLTTAIILSIVDIKIRKIPNEMLLVMLAISVVLHIIRAENVSFGSHVLGLVTGLFIFFAGEIISGGGKVGSGDIKLAACIGFMAGFPLALPVLLIASVAVSIMGGIMIMCGKISRRTPIPYAPFMMAGLIIAVVGNASNLFK